MNELERAKCTEKAINRILLITKPIASTSKLIKHISVFLILSLHVFLSIHFKDFAWFASSGNIIAGFALTLVFYESSLAKFTDGVKCCYLNENPPSSYLPEYEYSNYPSVTTPGHIENALETRRKYFNEIYQNVSLYFWYTLLGIAISSYGQYLNLIICLK